MQKLYALASVICMVVLPVRFAQVLYQDLQHPEIWATDWLHDPRLYCPFCAVTVGIHGFLLIRRQLRRRRQAKQVARLDDLLADAVRKQRHGRWQEADRDLDEFEALFIQRYGRPPASFLR